MRAAFRVEDASEQAGLSIAPAPVALLHDAAATTTVGAAVVCLAMSCACVAHCVRVARYVAVSTYLVDRAQVRTARIAGSSAASSSGLTDLVLSYLCLRSISPHGPPLPPSV